MTKKRNIGMLILMGILMVLSLFTISASAEDGGAKFQPGMIIDGSKLTLGDSAFSPNYGIAPHRGLSGRRWLWHYQSREGYCQRWRIYELLPSVRRHYTWDCMWITLQEDGTWQTVWAQRKTGK